MEEKLWTFDLICKSVGWVWAASGIVLIIKNQQQEKKKEKKKELAQCSIGADLHIIQIRLLQHLIIPFYHLLEKLQPPGDVQVRNKCWPLFSRCNDRLDVNTRSISAPMIRRVVRNAHCIVGRGSLTKRRMGARPRRKQSRAWFVCSLIIWQQTSCQSWEYIVWFYLRNSSSQPN